MRTICLSWVVALLLISCDNTRVFEKNIDFEAQQWLVNEKPEFEFTIGDTIGTYNIYGNVRNSISYPYSRVFVNYSLKDSTGNELHKRLINHMLFDPKTGKPEGSSGLGDIYDHRILLQSKYKFPYAGKYTISFEQFMRTDTLQGVLAVGARVEMAALPDNK